MNTHFYQELINRFFQSHSYFFLCLKYYLETDSSFKTNEAIHQILDRAIGYLAGSSDAALELREISKIRGFNNFYAALESQLHQINFRSMQPTQFKKTIQSLAVFLLNSLAHLLAKNEYCCTELNTYLQLKLALRQLLKKNNGASHPQIDLGDHSEEQAHPNPKSTNSKKPTNKFAVPVQQKRLDGGQWLNFEPEIDIMLGALSIRILPSQDSAAQTEFLAAVHRCFFRLMGLAMYTGTRPVQTIAEHVITLLEIIKNHHVPINDFMLELIHRAKTSIQSKAYRHDSQKILTDLFEDYDRYIALLREQISNRCDQSAQQDQLRVTEDQNASGNFQTPADRCTTVSYDEHHNDQSRLKADDEAIAPSEPIQARNEPHSPIPAANNVEDAKSELTQNSTFKQAADLIETTMFIAQNDQTIIDSTVPEFRPMGNNGKDTNYLYSNVFSEEAEGYYKMILNATIKLNGEGNAQSCLEDIELAAYSIKLLAQKFGMEKIAALPAIIESLSYQANRRLVKLPFAIVQKIEEAVSLLAMFDQHQADHKIRFNSIFAALKQYYEKTFQTREVDAFVP